MQGYVGVTVRVLPDSCVWHDERELTILCFATTRRVSQVSYGRVRTTRKVAWTVLGPRWWDQVLGRVMRQSGGLEWLLLGTRRRKAVRTRWV